MTRIIEVEAGEGTHVYVRGKRFKRITVSAVKCADCGAGRRSFHVFGCDQEMCPNCGGKLFSCSCDEVYLEVSE